MTEIKRPIAPCKWCDKHEVGCHGKCEEYKAFEEAHKEWKLHFNDGKDEFDRYIMKYRKSQR